MPQFSWGNIDKKSQNTLDAELLVKFQYRRQDNLEGLELRSLSLMRASNRIIPPSDVWSGWNTLRGALRPSGRWLQGAYPLSPDICPAGAEPQALASESWHPIRPRMRMSHMTEQVFSPPEHRIACRLLGYIVSTYSTSTQSTYSSGRQWEHDWCACSEISTRTSRYTYMLIHEGEYA